MAFYPEEADSAEDSLADDDIERFNGTLTFATETGPTSIIQDGIDTSIAYPLPDPRHVLSGRPGPVSIRFDISDARIEHGDQQRDKFVLYTIVVLQSAGVDSLPAKVSKRYTDFDRLNSALRKRYSQLMKNIQFPTKRVSGNFKAETIARRSRSFEQYLSHLFSVEAIRTSTEFTDFFYGVDVREGYRQIQNGLYEEALCLLLRSWRMQVKILEDCNVEVVATLCAITACYCVLENNEPALTYAESALACIADSTERWDDARTAVVFPNLVPLLKLTVWLCWKVGRDKKDLEKRLHDFKGRGYDVDGAPTLLELVVNRYKTTKKT